MENSIQAEVDKCGTIQPHPPDSMILTLFPIFMPSLPMHTAHPNHLPCVPLGGLGCVGWLTVGLITASVTRDFVADLSLVAVVVSTGLLYLMDRVVRRLAVIFNRALGNAVVVRRNNRPRQRYNRSRESGLHYLNGREGLGEGVMTSYCGFANWAGKRGCHQ